MTLGPEQEGLPAVDERLVMPESGYEVIDGRVVRVRPSDPPCATQHSKLQALLEVATAQGYVVACDLLTRTSRIDDLAPAASVYPAPPDPRTGGRQLEVLAFEVVSTERLAAAGDKAARLRGRGVRRVFAIDVARRRVLEWGGGDWRVLAQDAAISDEALAVPLAVADLVSTERVDDALARALLSRGNPVLEAALFEVGRAEGLEAGRVAGKAAALLSLLEARGFEVSDAQQDRIRGAGDEALDRWLVGVLSAPDAAALLDD